MGSEQKIDPGRTVLIVAAQLFLGFLGRKLEGHPGLGQAMGRISHQGHS
jgi:hypothetical protein